VKKIPAPNYQTVEEPEQRVRVRQHRLASSTEDLHGLSERTRADMEAALERACRALPPDRDNYQSRKFVAERLIEHVQKGEYRLSQLIAAAKGALAELHSR
jgi:hypothetical protein